MPAHRLMLGASARESEVTGDELGHAILGPDVFPAKMELWLPVSSLEVVGRPLGDVVDIDLLRAHLLPIPLILTLWGIPA